MTTPSSRPGPTFNCWILFDSFVANSSYIPSCTKTRLAVTQVWPELRNLATMAASIAVSILASSKTMNGLFPPSSSESFLTVDEHCDIRILPTRVLPVKLTLRTDRLVHNSAPTSATLCNVVITLIDPTGNPACVARTACAKAERGVSPAGFHTVVHPAA